MQTFRCDLGICFIMLWEQELIAIGTGTSYALDAEVVATHLFSQNRGPYCL